MKTPGTVNGGELTSRSQSVTLTIGARYVFDTLPFISTVAQFVYLELCLNYHDCLDMSTIST